MHEIKNKKEFEDLVSQKPSMLVFSAPWCGPCRMMGPLYKIVSEEYKNKINVIKVNSDDQELKELAVKYQVRSIPAIFFLNKKGEAVEALVGAQSKQKLEGGIAAIA